MRTREGILAGLKDWAQFETAAAAVGSKPQGDLFELLTKYSDISLSDKTQPPIAAAHQETWVIPARPVAKTIRYRSILRPTR